VDIEWQHNRNRVRRRDPRQELSFLVNKDTNPGIGLTGAVKKQEFPIMAVDHLKNAVFNIQFL
jgi:hypothetical protein